MTDLTSLISSLDFKAIGKTDTLDSTKSSHLWLVQQEVWSIAARILYIAKTSAVRDWSQIFIMFFWCFFWVTKENQEHLLQASSNLLLYSQDLSWEHALSVRFFIFLATISKQLLIPINL